MHEASMHEKNCFLTLTLDDGHLPDDGSLDVAVWQRFAGRVRTDDEKYLKQGGRKRPPFRFYHAGEYGEQLGRPHYHACVFGRDWSEDRVQVTTRQDFPVFNSEHLAQLWENGSCEIGSLTSQSAAYVARYVMKKVSGARLPEHYGELKPEYATMSRRPGIGQTWIQKYHEEVYAGDFCIVNGRKVKPPKYYDLFLKNQKPDMWEEIQEKREFESKKHLKDRTKKRLEQRAKNLEDKMKRLEGLR